MSEAPVQSRLRVHAAAAFAVTTAVFFLTVHHSRVDKLLLAGIQEGPSRFFPAFWEISLRAFGTHLMHIAALIGICWVFAGCGRLLLRAFRVEFSNAWETAAFSFGLGSGARVDWRYLFSGEGLLRYFLYPWKMVFYGNQLGNSMGPLFIGLSPVLVLFRLSRNARLLGYLALGCWLPLSVVVHLPRYFVPTLPLLSLLFSLVILQAGLPWLRNALVALACAGFAATGLSYWGFVLPKTRCDVFKGQKSFSEFLCHADRRGYPAPLYPAAQYIHRHTAPEAKVLVFGDSRGFYLGRDHIVSTPGQVTVLERWANASASGQDLKAVMDAHCITHIAVNHAAILHHNLKLSFSRKGKRSLDEFWERYTLKLFQAGPDYVNLPGGRVMIDRWVAVYKVLSEEEAADDHPHDNLFEMYKIEE